MKKEKLTILLIAFIGTVAFVYLLLLNQKMADDLSKSEAALYSLWDEKIAAYQFNVNITFRYSETRKGFFDSLDICYNKLRVLTKQGDLTEHDKQYLTNFVHQQMPNGTGISQALICERLGVNSFEAAFNGSRQKIIERFDRVLNPNFMTKCRFFQDFDIWEKRERLGLMPGDTTVFMIRLLKNYDLNSHQTELIPSKNLKVIKPYLGELTVVVPIFAKKGDYHKTSFEIYNWIDRDTVTQEISMEIE
jgi:hypothetical protein